MRWTFHADSASVDDLGCSFEAGVRHFALMYEDGRVCRMWWHDGSDGRDERTVSIGAASLHPDRVVIAFKGEGCPYDVVEISYDDPDDRFGDFKDVLAHLLEAEPTRLTISEEAYLA